MANLRRGAVEIEVRGKTVDFSLPFSNLERLETRLRMGVPKLLSLAEKNEITLTQCVTILEIASNGQLKRQDIHKWADKDGMLKIIEAVSELMSATFNTNESNNKKQSEKKS